MKNINDIKIAICFSGQIRTGVLTQKNISNFIGELIHQSDIFVHTWDVISETSSDLSIAGIPFKEPDSLFEDFSNLWNPKKMIVEDYNEWTHKGIRIEPLFYSLIESNKIRKYYETNNNIKYDFVIKIRPDFIYPKTYSLKNEIEAIINSNDINTIYTLDWGNVIEYGKLEDCLWIADSKTFDIVCDFYYYRLNKFVTTDWQTQMPEYLTKNNIEYKKLYCGNYGTPYRWSTLYERNLTVEDYQANWEKHYYNL